MLVNTTKIFEKANKKHYAVPAFNFTNFEQLKAIIIACENKKCDAILATSTSAIDFLGIDNIVAVTKNLTNKSKNLYALHLDHGKTFEDCKMCIDNGYTSVMIDASFLPFNENVKLTKKVVNYAHKHNVTVEAELGKLSGVEDLIQSKNSTFTDKDEAKKFIDKTNIDSLAISIGTSHGAYKFKGKSYLDIERLKEIKKTTNNFPLVLHGASSLDSKLINKFNKSGGQLENAKGLSKDNLLLAIENGINKINTDTDLRIAFTTGVKECLKKPDEFNLRNYLKMAIEETTSLCEQKIDIYTYKK